MAPSTVYLPNGQTITVSPVFAGFSFKANDLNIHHSIFPPGWTIILESGDDEAEDTETLAEEKDVPYGYSNKKPSGKFRRPTLHNDNLFISSISNPSNTDFKPATSPTRQIAMMLWATLSWYFHQPEPDPHLSRGIDPNTPEKGRPKGQWRVNIKREGIFKAKNCLAKLERMGIIQSEESSVGVSTDERAGEGWQHMFASQCSFWQLDARIYLFTLSPTQHSPFPGASPYPSRPSSPNRDSVLSMSGLPSPRLPNQTPENDTQHGGRAHSPGPFTSNSHLPTYYPPPPPNYTFTNSIRHPIRPKPPSQGTTFYTRYIPSIGQYLSFRTASISSKSPTYRGPMSGGAGGTPNFLPPNSGISQATLPTVGTSLSNMNIHLCDTDLLHDWMNQPRVNAFWGCAGPLSVQETMLTKALSDKHSFPVIGCWDGKPFGYFEIYWVKEDPLGRFVPGRDSSHYDRGFHALVGEQEFRGEHRAKVWMSALVHYCWLADYRTQRVLCEPRVDNQKMISYLEDVGFAKEKEIAFPHKQAALMKVVREGWQAPEI